MNWANAVRGSVTTLGYQDWVELSSFQFGSFQFEKYGSKKPRIAFLRIADPNEGPVFLEWRQAGTHQLPW